MVFKGKKLQNVPLTRADLRIRKIEEQLGKEIVRSERTREQVLDLQYWWKRFALFLIDRDKSKCKHDQTRSKHFKATRGWFLLVSRCQRRLHEAVCFEVTKSVIPSVTRGGSGFVQNMVFGLAEEHATAA